MRNWRRKIYPRNPHNFAEFINQLQYDQNNKLLAYNTSIMTVDVVTDDDDCQHIIFYDKDFIRQLFTRSVSKVFIDGTFKTTPNLFGAYQLVTVMVVAYGHVSGLLLQMLVKNSLSSLLPNIVISNGRIFLKFFQIVFARIFPYKWTYFGKSGTKIIVMLNCSPPRSDFLKILSSHFFV